MLEKLKWFRLTILITLVLLMKNWMDLFLRKNINFFLTELNINLNWLNWFNFLIVEGGLHVILIDCMIFLAPLSSCFPRSAILWNSLSIECFPLTYDLNGFKGCVCYILLVCFLCLKESTCETRKNVFYFTSEPLFILEITKF